jgi:hypothetical protein
LVISKLLPAEGTAISSNYAFSRASIIICLAMLADQIILSGMVMVFTVLKVWHLKRLTCVSLVDSALDLMVELCILNILVNCL